MPAFPALMRVLLLAVLAFGIEGMHTLGHEGVAIRHDFHSAAPTMRDSPVAMATQASGMQQGPGTPHSPAGPLSACLAILSLAVLTVLVLTCLKGASPQQLRAGIGALVHCAGRGLPRPRRAGLTLATVAVMRT